MDYHGIAKEYYGTHPELPPGTPKEHVPHVKRAVVSVLKKRLEDLGQSPPAGSATERLPGAHIFLGYNIWMRNWHGEWAKLAGVTGRASPRPDSRGGCLHA